MPRSYDVPNTTELTRTDAFGGEPQYQNTERYAYTVRGQINFNKTIDAEQNT
ncbi:MAG: hypothetical protein ACLTZT_01655 [Butyricimonas faecalis]